MDHRPAPTADRLLSIHYLRAIAAIMVIVYHVFSHRLVPVPNAGAVVWLKQGVGIFFVISGYVMVSSTARGDVSAGQFLWRRLRRIAPILLGGHRGLSVRDDRGGVEPRCWLVPVPARRG